MNKCKKCGTEFEGNCCPNCGEWAGDYKLCPKCGTKLNADAKFCSGCGFAFGSEVKQKSGSSFGEEFAKVKEWVKSHLKIVVPVVLAVVLVLVLAISIPTCVAAQNNGTYYKLNYNGELDNKTYFIINSGTWTDEDGESGDYKLDGENIIFYYTFFGETTEMASGTLKDFVLKVDMDTYICDKHSHNYEYNNTATCIKDGKIIGTCICGNQTVEEASALGHDYKDGRCVRCNELKPSEGLELKLSSDNKSYSVTGIGTCTDSEIVLPSFVNGKPVTSIGEEAFYNCSSLTSIIIPDGVTSIGEKAFYGCDSLQYNEYDNVLYLGNTNNKYVVLIKAKNQSITSCEINSNTNCIYDSAFNGCSELASITIPDGVTSIGEEVFYNCSSLTSITIPDSVTEIGGFAFYGCSSLTSVTIPDSVTSVGNGVLGGCSSLTSVAIPDSVTSIGYRAFYCCSSLTSITIPDGVTSIGENAFYDCSKLASITIPNGVTSIGENAFYDCSNLTSIVIPDSVTDIGKYAFRYCSSLTSITIPDSVTSIGIGAFFDCSGLQYNEHDNALYLGNENNKYVVLIKAKNQSITSCEINSNTMLISYSAFSGCRSLTNISIPDSVTSIGDEAFSNCRSLTSVTIGDNVISIGDTAFYDCRSLTNITIPDSVTSIAKFAFCKCSSLASVTFKGSKEQWKAIIKGTRWNEETGNYTVHCSDGDLSKD